MFWSLFIFGYLSVAMCSYLNWSLYKMNKLLRSKIDSNRKDGRINPTTNRPYHRDYECSEPVQLPGESYRDIPQMWETGNDDVRMSQYTSEMTDMITSDIKEMGKWLDKVSDEYGLVDLPLSKLPTIPEPFESPPLNQTREIDIEKNSEPFENMKPIYLDDSVDSDDFKNSSNTEGPLYEWSTV